MAYEAGRESWRVGHKIATTRLFLNEKVKVTSRKTTDLLQVLASFGGLFFITSTFMSIVVRKFSLPSINAQFANRIFTWMKPKSWLEPKMKEGKP
jgi:hypothetical protein